MRWPVWPRHMLRRIDRDAGKLGVGGGRGGRRLRHRGAAEGAQEQCNR